MPGSNMHKEYPVYSVLGQLVYAPVDEQSSKRISIEYGSGSCYRTL